MEDVARRRAEGQVAHVRTVAYCGDDGTIAYSMIGPGSHYCMRIDRAHRSNHVFFVLDFGTGQFCQKCHDPECWGYRSPWMPIPPDVWGRDALAPLIAAREAALQLAAAEAALRGGLLALPAPPETLLLEGPGDPPGYAAAM